MSDHIGYKQWDWYGHVIKMNEERLPENFWNCVRLEGEEREELAIRECSN